ncbi:pyridine nucleotide-disulfide oxidoreductase [Actinomyces sp. HMSC035G02]|uniref:pyridine nucleotide-disulfide oxidoreductase n=1 Tax=Actinomyces sp. HMSC035G02 TaxID=1739406 RepID=UPI0008A8BE7F|nr:pyridine nucleotide-disulfide oxidoreductase [Actinomyces sp. HMSC035G02]MBS5722739.1 pyridine nucleotide-disulfide oxidoreductase [Actinomyces sp.]OHR18069.1 pyridine nucleotide-disulfide oxidoreductase [Actinomyces sp. HMSC035G02]
MTDPNAPLREVRRWMRVSTPVNKAASAGLRGRLPQIAGPLMIGALGVGALGAGIAWRALSSTRGTGRTQRFVDLATAALDSGFPLRSDEGVADEGAARVPRRVVHVEVGEGFGRPSLVSIDIVVASSDALSEREVATRALDAITRATWNNPEMAPVSVRARVLAAHDEAGDLEAPGAQTDTVVDMSALGFTDEIARPDELYDRYGAPECDPAWRP